MEGNDTYHDGGPAFPVSGQGTDEDELSRAYGMTLRDWFAGQVIVGMLPGESWADTDPNFVADCAYNIAEAMLMERRHRERVDAQSEGNGDGS